MNARPPFVSRRLSRRTLLGAGAALLAAGLTFSAAPQVFADQGNDGGPETFTVPVPEGIAAGENWVDVNLTQQVAVALTGSKIQRVILSTTGQPGYETPTGQFRILTRVANEHMTSDGIGIPRDAPDGYDLYNVLWTQYFTEGGDALHDNYWRPLSVFGHEATSHGCVGMVESDARYLWNFVGVGSLVNIHF